MCRAHASSRGSCPCWPVFQMSYCCIYSASYLSETWDAVPLSVSTSTGLPWIPLSVSHEKHWGSCKIYQVVYHWLVTELIQLWVFYGDFFTCDILWKEIFLVNVWKNEDSIFWSVIFQGGTLWLKRGWWRMSGWSKLGASSQPASLWFSARGTMWQQVACANCSDSAPSLSGWGTSPWGQHTQLDSDDWVD